MLKKINFPLRKVRRPKRDLRSKRGNYYDPVCGMEATGDFFVINYQGQDYYFCSEYCKVKFSSAPLVYRG